MRIIHKEQVYMEVDKGRGDKEGGGLEYTEFHLRYYYSYLMREFILCKNTYTPSGISYVGLFLRKINECNK